METGAKNLKLNEVLNEMDKLINESIFKTIAKFEGPYQYLVKEQWPETLPHTRNGIYFYTDTKEEIWYIGKGVFSNNDGIGHRVCSHLGATNNKQNSDVIFPRHQWTEDSSVEKEIKESIKRGYFVIWTFPVQPDYIIPMVEVYLQTTFLHQSSCLPPLNKKIG